MEALKESVQYIKGIGPKRYALLNRLGIYTIEDAISYYPRDYEVWGAVEPIEALEKGKESSIVARFKGRAHGIRSGRLNILKWTAYDKTGEVQCIWYNQPYRMNQYKEGKEYFIRGKVEIRYGEIQIIMPEVEEYRPKKHDNPKILPIYPLTKGLTQKIMQQLIYKALKRIDTNLYDFLPSSIRRDYGLAEKNFALYNIHFPKNRHSFKEARRRLIFEELFFVNMGLRLIKKESQEQVEGIMFDWDQGIIESFIADLPFELTRAQARVVDEILLDIRSGKVANRLIQGDVGSGKTILAAIALYASVLSGYQGAFMVPTEILANQHFQSLTRLFSNTTLKIECITGGMGKRQKSSLRQSLKNGEIDIIIGTHSLLQDDITFDRLGIVVTDEQHRFGVRQRAVILSKGQNPHILVMSATPIPRTLSLILYGDLDISIIDELPPGRRPIETYHVPPALSERVYKFVKRQVLEGRQAYIVCPLIEESDIMDLTAATRLY
ncbi:MAG: ATP-dependent DNA helicase RecG, partial [Clostridiales bacterium]|nr:ATP-dependent DNA helicase RecG [Clostridiales bacterium]